MSIEEKEQLFRTMHVPGNPVVLCNVWNEGSAKTVERSGAKAIGTSSWSVAAALGYEDGQNLPFEELLRVVKGIAGSTNLPLTVDFEAGYASDLAQVSDHLIQLMNAGVIGVNFEDQNLSGAGLYSLEEQTARIRTLRATAQDYVRPLFINARTDIFLQETEASAHSNLVNQAIERANAYKSAGAECFFVPGLSDKELIREICEKVELPVNIMLLDHTADLRSYAELGVARISFGPWPYMALDALLNDMTQCVCAFKA